MIFGVGQFNGVIYTNPKLTIVAMTTKRETKLATGLTRLVEMKMVMVLVIMKVLRNYIACYLDCFLCCFSKSILCLIRPQFNVQLHVCLLFCCSGNI